MLFSLSSLWIQVGSILSSQTCRKGLYSWIFVSGYICKVVIRSLVLIPSCSSLNKNKFFTVCWSSVPGFHPFLVLWINEERHGNLGFGQVLTFRSHRQACKCIPPITKAWTHSIEGSLPLALLVEARGLVLVSVNEVVSHPLPPQIKIYCVRMTVKQQ